MSTTITTEACARTSTRGLTQSNTPFAVRTRRPLWMFVFDAVSFVVFGALLLPLLQRVMQKTASRWDFAILAVSIPLGLAAADLASGLVHWFCDTCFEEDTPVIGRLMIFPFREHHRDPLAITRHNFLELTGASCFALCLPLTFDARVGAPLSFEAFLAVFCIAMFATNLFHRWAHAGAAPGIAKWLQRHAIILKAEHHDRHHGHEGGAYCVTNGWMEPALELALRFSKRSH